ncbi:MAG: heat-inducible transcriptional repressor HrcA [Spirochaetia bacterium]|nr:heat-inducible transcriptional repressor HrcA [Spirochaetia bacterium]
MLERITKRQAEIVRAVVNGYVLTGQPVGSAIIVERFICDISSATVRKEMSVLEQMGYLFSPHTSAGRIPTDLGMELFIDELINIYEDSIENISEFEDFYKSANMQVDKLMKVTAQQLASASQNAGFVLTPAATGAVINRIEIVSVTDNIGLVILISQTGTIFQKKIKFETAHSQEDFYKISRYLNQMLKGYEIEDIKEKGLAFFFDSSTDLGDLGNSAMIVAQNLIYLPPDQQVLFEGEAALYKRLLEEHPNTGEAEKLVRILDDKEFLMELLNTLKSDKRINVQVGLDIDGEHISGISVLSRGYSVGGRNIGSLGVIGVNRMPYEQIIRSMDYSSAILSNVLKETGELNFNGEIIVKIGKLPERIFNI